MRTRDNSKQSDISQGVKLRHQVSENVANDITQAYELAKSIRHPWYKCQALSTIADYSTKTSIKSILQESFDSAMKCHDHNRRVSIACRPLRIAIKNDLRDLANSFLEQCINQINHEMDPISKWCAASIVHTIKVDSDLLKSFYNTFVSATSKGHGWCVEREIKFMLSDHDIQKDKRYISYLIERQGAIARWKNENSQEKWNY